MAVKKSTRFEVFKRDSFTCQYCGRSAPDITLEIDHIQPESKGGTDDILNLITSCFDCNRGKSDKTLSEDTVIQKRKQQLDELQKRREQLEMLMEWQKGLINLDSDILEEINNLWEQLVPGYFLSDSGLQKIRKWIRKWELMEIVDALRISADQYLRYTNTSEGEPKPTPESVEKVFNYIPGIIANRKRYKDHPDQEKNMKNLYYIRGILKNRLNYMNDAKCLDYLVQACDFGISIETLTNLAKSTKNWTLFVQEISQLIQENENHEHKSNE